MAWTLDFRVSWEKSTSCSSGRAGAKLFSSLGLVLVSSVLGCSPGKTAPQTVAQQPTPSNALIVAEATEEEPQEKGAVPDRFLHLEPVEVQHLPQLGSGLPVQVSRAEVESKKLPLPSETTLWVALDDHPPRRIGTRKITFAKLLNEDQELAPGFHFLTLLDEKKPGVLGFNVHAFFLEVRGDERPPGPDCMLFTRELTYNGPKAADDVRVWVVPLTEEVEQIRLFAEGPDFESKAELKPGLVIGLKDPASGDYHFRATCLSLGVAVSSLSRTITINRDAQVEGESQK